MHYRKNIHVLCGTRDLGHMSEKGMTVLVKKYLLKGVKGVHIKKCSNCLAGKQHKVAFKSQVPHKKPKVLDLVHSDVCKMSVRSMGGANICHIY
jgi:hypothetical protein